MKVLHDEMQDLIEDQTNELNHKINKRTNTIVCDIKDLKATLTACCDDLADDIFCTQKLIKDEFKEQTALINHKFHDQRECIEEQTKEIKHKINHQTDILISAKLLK